MDEHGRHYAKSKKSVTELQILHDPTYTSKIVQLKNTGTIVVAKDWGVKEMKNYCSMGIKFELHLMNLSSKDLLYYTAWIVNNMV